MEVHGMTFRRVNERRPSSAVLRTVGTLEGAVTVLVREGWTEAQIVAVVRAAVAAEAAAT
jgi:hypothetical protein